MIYEIINPSDPITIEAEEELIAQVVTLLLGQGKMGLKDEAHETVLPLFLFGGADEWLEERGIVGETGLNDFIVLHRRELAECFMSAMVCKPGQRRALLKALQGAPDPQKALQVYNEEQRSSLNDFCGYAHAWGRKLLKQAEVDECPNCGGTGEMTRIDSIDGSVIRGTCDCRKA